MSAHRPGALLPVCLLLTLLLSAAHWWRAGQAGVALACLLWWSASLRRAAWMRPLTALLLLLLAAEWFLTADQFIQLRQMRHQPWLRLALILTATAAVTLLTALLVWGSRGRRWFSRHAESAGAQALCFLLVTALLLPLLVLSPRILLLERFFPGLGPLQIVCAALWGAWLCRRVSDRQSAPGIRGRPPAPKSSPARPKVGSPCRERRDFPRKRTHVVTLLIINELLVTSLFWENAPIGSWAPTSVSLTRQELPFSRAPAAKEHTVLSWDYCSHIPRHSRR